MDHEPHIPGRLGEDLKRVYRASVPVPGEVDARLLGGLGGLGAAGTGIARPRSVARERAPMRWRVVKWVGMAAAVFLALMVPTQLSRNPQGPAVVAGDYNRDGVVDILDAFALARAMRDGDGSITEAEIDAAAARAVALSPRRAGGGA